MLQTAFVFPGQGSQYIKMGLAIAGEYEIASKTFSEADEALGFKISEICFSGPEDKLRQTSFTQPAILTVSVAILRILDMNGVKPNVVAGHSLGEYSALVAAGVLEFKEAVRLVHLRGKLMEEALAPGKGTMAAVMGLNADEVKKVCQEAAAAGIVQPANYNCPGQIVIAGTKEAVEKAAEVAKHHGAKRVILLNVSGPFHSKLMEYAAEEFSTYLEKTDFSEPKMPIVANYNAKSLNNVHEIQNALLLQIANPVLWEQSIHTILKTGINQFVEVGPGKILSGLIKKVAPESKQLNTDDQDSLRKCIALLKECG